MEGSRPSEADVWLTRPGTVLTGLHWRVAFALAGAERERRELLAAYRRGEIASPFAPEPPLPCPAGQMNLTLA